MPYHFEFDFDHRILLAVLEGEVQDDEMRRGNAELQAHITELGAAAGITDASAVTTFGVSSQTVRELALRPSKSDRPFPRFLVAPTDFLYGMGRMYEIIADREHMQVVRSRGEALAALGVQNPKFERLAG